MVVYKIPLERCHTLILEYQNKADPTIFFVLLAKFDRLLVSFVHEIRKKDPPIADEDIQELYHTAIIGLGEFIEIVKESDDPKMLPALLKSKVKAAIRRTFRYKYRDWEGMLKGIEWVERVSGHMPDADDKLNTDDLRRIVKASKLTREEQLCVVLHYGEGKLQKDIAKEYGFTVDQVRYRVKIGLEKLKKVYRQLEEIKGD